jgi:hypothetical protein
MVIAVMQDRNLTTAWFVAAWTPVQSRHPLLLMRQSLHPLYAVMRAALSLPTKALPGTSRRQLF